MSSFFMQGALDKLGDNRLVKLSKLIDWSQLERHLRKIHKNDIDPSGGGQKPYDHLGMLKTILLREWHNLSDAQMEEALKVRIDFMVFTGFELGARTPDETTICRFRNALVRRGIDKKVFREVNHELERLGLKVEHATGAVIDATIVEAAARPRRAILVEEDREESETTVTIEESADPDARWLKKGAKCHFGYKGFAVTDTDGGYIQAVKVASANVAEVGRLPELLPEIKATRIYADKAYESAANREALAGKHKCGLMRRARRGHPLSERQKKANKLISKQRYIVEQCFGTLKRVFGFSRTSYMGRVKVEGQMQLKAICFNLLKGLKMTEIVA